MIISNCQDDSYHNCQRVKSRSPETVNCTGSDNIAREQGREGGARGVNIKQPSLNNWEEQLVIISRAVYCACVNRAVSKEMC